MWRQHGLQLHLQLHAQLLRQLQPRPWLTHCAWLVMPSLVHTCELLLVAVLRLSCSHWHGLQSLCAQTLVPLPRCGLHTCCLVRPKVGMITWR